MSSGVPSVFSKAISSSFCCQSPGKMLDVFLIARISALVNRQTIVDKDQLQCAQGHGQNETFGIKGLIVAEKSFIH
jgi:hypothetical protein